LRSALKVVTVCSAQTSSLQNLIDRFSSDEEVADVSLQDRIRSLNWVTAGFLETKLDFSRQAVRNLLDDAISEMIDINSHRRSDEKLACLVRCSHKIFEALKESGAPTSADEFLPVLIYVLLKGNPPLIQSNVKFISRFALPSRIMSGESGYFFTNLSCALQFVQDMNYASLKMERAEFEAYTSGDLVPPLNMMNCGCNQVGEIYRLRFLPMETAGEMKEMVPGSRIDGRVVGSGARTHRTTTRAVQSDR
uniref:VPS9 domain-containing protein n=1 Tax=Heligmosomoides polygyrus TaxID=6339 RepID=A0A183GK28_HELPZ